MKNLFTFLLASALCIMAFGGYSQCETLWGGPDDPNGSFDGGLNDWTTSVGMTSPDSAVWEWRQVPISMGAFFGTRGPIESESVDNGAVVFDADFYETGGIGIGQGPYPVYPASMYEAYLTSPSIDLSGESSVWLRFNHYYRRFSSATAIVEVSNDGGTSWVSYEVTPAAELPSNQGTAADFVEVVDITDVAANEANVMIRFKATMNFYFWMIDDVTLFSAPETELALTDFFYPIPQYRRAACSIVDDTLGFSASVTNVGTTPTAGVTVTATVTENETGDTLFLVTQVFDSAFAANGEDTVQLNLDELVILNDMDPGLYRVDYTIMGNEEDCLAGLNSDFGNEDGEFFRATDSTFTETVGDPGIAYRPGGAEIPWAVGILTYPGMCAESCSGEEETMVIDSVSWTFAIPVGYELEGKSIILWVMKINDREIIEGDVPFTTDNTDIETHPDLTPVGFQIINLDDTYEEFTPYTSSILDYDSLTMQGSSVQGAPVEDNAYYFVIAEVPAGMFFGFEERLDYPDIGTITISEQWFLGGFTGGPDAALGYTITCDDRTLASDDILPDYAVNIYPNPVSDFLNVDLALDRNTDVEISVMDLLGKTITKEQVFIQGSGSWKYDASDLSAGAYLLHVQTKDGYKAVKFNVVK